jgi:hypothetical protein
MTRSFSELTKDFSPERRERIEQFADQHAIAWLCRPLGVARSGDYACNHRQQAPQGKRQAENAVITAEIQAVFQEHRGFYGPPRIHQDLRAAGRPIGRHASPARSRCAAVPALASAAESPALSGAWIRAVGTDLPLACRTAIPQKPGCQQQSVWP